MGSAVVWLRLPGLKGERREERCERERQEAGESVDFGELPDARTVA